MTKIKSPVWLDIQSLLNKVMFSTILHVHLVIILVIQTGMSSGGRLELNPKMPSAIRLAGEDRSFFISCIPYSSVGPVGDSRIRAKELSWKKLQKPPIGDGWVTMGSVQHSRVHVEQSANGRGLDLVFRSIRSDDGGEYACEAIIDGHKERQLFNLNVIEPISFEGTPKVQSVEEGSNSFTLLCKVSGNPKPRITWNVRGKIMFGSNEKYQVTDAGLVIRNITQTDRGSYKCKATQSEEGVTDFQDMVIALKVQHEPEWPAKQRGEFFGFISGITNLSCEANAEPPAQFIWLNRQNKEIDKSLVINEDHKSTLMLPVTHDDLFGDYTCIARNKMGTLRKVVTLSEGAKPGIPTIEIYKIDHSSAEMTIMEHKAEMFLEIVGFDVEYKEKTADWSNASKLYFPKRDDERYLISGLQSKTFYHLRARARNLAGQSDPSNMIYLQTSAPHVVGELLGSEKASTAVISSALSSVLASMVACSFTRTVLFSGFT